MEGQRQRIYGGTEAEDRWRDGDMGQMEHRGKGQMKGQRQRIDGGIEAKDIRKDRGKGKIEGQRQGIGGVIGVEVDAWVDSGIYILYAGRDGQVTFKK